MSESQGNTNDYLEGLLEGFVAYDAAWRMTYMNAAGERLLGRKRGDVLGKTWHEAFPHAVGNPVDLMYQRVMAQRRPERLELFYEHYGRWFEISASPVQSGGVAVYFRDVTDRVEAVRELEKAAEALRLADRRKDEFLAVLGHELRNPLAPIRNGLHFLAVTPPGSEGAQEVRAMMDRQMRHLVRLVDDLLEVSRITTGKLELRREKVDLGSVIESAVEAARPAIDAAGHSFSLVLPRERATLHADPVRLAQVLANLLNNAARYTPAKGHIELSLSREEDGAAISVRDDGPGIDPELLPRMFQLFAQGREARGSGGLGVGLMLARTLVELHGGSLHAASPGPGQGAQFTVRLPGCAWRAAATA